MDWVRIPPPPEAEPPLRSVELHGRNPDVHKYPTDAPVDAVVNENTLDVPEVGVSGHYVDLRTVAAPDFIH